MCPFTLSGRIPIVALVGFYPANWLMGRGPILLRSLSSLSPYTSNIYGRIRYYPIFLPAIPVSRVRHPRVTHQSATLGREQAPALPFDLHA